MGRCRPAPTGCRRRNRRRRPSAASSPSAPLSTRSSFVIDRFVLGPGGGGGFELGSATATAPGRRAACEHAVDGVDDVVPVLGDEPADPHPQVDAVAADEVAGTGGDRAQDGLLLKNLVTTFSSHTSPADVTIRVRPSSPA